MSLTIHRTLFAFAMLAGLSGIASAQSTTTSTETKKFEVIAIDGNQLVVKLPEGTREITVPNDFRFTVNGQALSLQQLKPGMAGTATITTTTKSTPVTVTEVKNGTVEHAAGRPSSSAPMKDSGRSPRARSTSAASRSTRAGKPANVSDFRPGDKLSAVIITSMPPKVVTQQEVNATLAASGRRRRRSRGHRRPCGGGGGSAPRRAAAGRAGAAGRPGPAAGGASAAAGTSGAGRPHAAQDRQPVAPARAAWRYLPVRRNRAHDSAPFV